MSNVNIDQHECPCPSCGFYTTGETEFGSYNICPLCNWEDDAVQLANPASSGGANSASLIAYQQRSMDQFPLHIHAHDSYMRDPQWRPLDAEEILVAERDSRETRWKHHAVSVYADAYWMKPRRM